MKIYHNNRCRKSRESLAILEASNQSFEIVNYLENPPSKKELIEILRMLELKPIGLIRKNEVIWKENFKGKALSDVEIINAMLEYPKLIERPIIVKNNKAVIGRSPEKIKEIL